MDLVDDDPVEAGEDARRIVPTQHQGKAFGCRQQDMRRVRALAPPPRLRRIPGPILDADGKPHLLHRSAQVPADIGGERLQGRDIECVEARRWGLTGLRCQVHERWQKARKRLARPGRRDQKLRLCLRGEQR